MKKRGFIMVIALYLLIILLLVGMGYLSGQVAKYRGASALASAVAARGVAEAGLEDARVKLQKDMFFPPQDDPREQRIYGYTEPLVGFTPSASGSYSVTVDMRYARPPYQMIKVTSIGMWSPPNEPPVRHVLSIEVSAVNYTIQNRSDERTVALP